MISLVLGGARSGKSEVGERLAARLSVAAKEAPSAGVPPVTYVATAVAGIGDAEFDERIAQHRARRPPHWVTIEPAPGEALSSCLAAEGVVLVDSLGTWVAAQADFAVDTEELVESLQRRRAAGQPTVLVSEEVGLGVHPETRAGLAFRDALGALYRVVADVADDVLLVVAGRVLSLPREEP